MQRRRVHTIQETVAVNTAVDLIGTIDETNGVNAHGMRCSFTCLPDQQNANADGHWVIWCIPDEATAVPPIGTGALELEASNAFMWAIGTWSGSNETPYCKDIELGTSRNCQKGARLVLSIRADDLTAGMLEVRASMTYFTKSL